MDAHRRTPMASRRSSAPARRRCASDWNRCAPRISGCARRIAASRASSRSHTATSARPDRADVREPPRSAERLADRVIAGTASNSVGLASLRCLLWAGIGSYEGNGFESLVRVCVNAPLALGLRVCGRTDTSGARNAPRGRLARKAPASNQWSTRTSHRSQSTSPAVAPHRCPAWTAASAAQASGLKNIGRFRGNQAPRSSGKS